MTPPTDPGSNHLLARLTGGEFPWGHAQLECVNLELGQVLIESGVKPSHVYFPTSAIVSLLYAAESGATAEIAAIGNEGLVGISPILGGEFTRSPNVVETAGLAFRMRTQAIHDEFERSAAAKHLLLRYIQVLMTQMALTAVCNRYHHIDQQLCRWLLLRDDRMSGRAILTTHESIASMLGVRREGVTQAAHRLQQDGLIAYSRGHVTVVDRGGLERRACECYGVVRKEYDRLLPDDRVAGPRRASRSGAMQPMADIAFAT